MYGSHNFILKAVEKAANDAGVVYSVGTTVQGRRTQLADCRVGTTAGPGGVRRDRFADIVFPDMTACGYRSQRVYGDVNPPERHRDSSRQPDGSAPRPFTRRRGTPTRCRGEDEDV